MPASTGQKLRHQRNKLIRRNIREYVAARQMAESGSAVPLPTDLGSRRKTLTRQRRRQNIAITVAAAIIGVPLALLLLYIFTV